MNIIKGAPQGVPFIITLTMDLFYTGRYSSDELLPKYVNTC